MTAGDTPGFAQSRSVLAHALAEAEERTLGELEPIRESLRQAVKAVMTQDAALANEVIARASEFDRRYGEVHDKLLALIARQAPVAGDLRLAMALLHVNDRAERMAAQCLNIATMCCALPAGTRPSAEQLECLSEMAQLADAQVGEAARIFAERDADGVRRLRARDMEINERNRSCFAIGVAEGERAERREAAFFIAFMARAIERIGDNAVDIAQQAAFVVTGRMRHPSGS